MIPSKHTRPVLAIVSDMPLGRLIPSEFQEKDRSLTPWIFSLFQALANQTEYDIHWITLKKYVSGYTVKSLHRQTIHILPDSSLAIGLLTHHFSASRKIRRLLDQLNPDLIHVWGIELAYATACKTQPRPKLLSYQGSLIASCQRSKMKMFPKIQAFWEKRTTPEYHHITCESPWIHDRILEISPSAQVSLIEYGVEESFHHVERSPSATPECLFAGNLNELKGVRYLIQAFMKPSLQHVQLYVAGSGELRKKLEPASTPNIHWVGTLQRPELQKRLSSAWCLVHPTLGDASPNCVKEARVIGLPVITTCEGGQTQYVIDGKSGYIIPVRDSETLGQAVLSLTESLEKNMAMGLYGVDEIRKALKIELTCSKFLSLYGSLLNGKPSSLPD
jgi:glycosyltransferase involved in cell wall biosynthesis